MVNWNNPTNSTNYSTVLTDINDKAASLAKQDYGSDTNLVTGSLRFNQTTKAREKWSGSVWAECPGNERAFTPVVTTTGTQPTYVAAPTVAWASYVTGDVLALNIHSANTGSSTVNVSTLGAKTIKWMGQNLVGGELTGKHYLVYNGTDFDLLNHGGGWATWTPTISCSGSLTFTASYALNLATYQRHGSRIDFIFEAQATTGGTASNEIRFTVPVSSGYGQSTVVGCAYHGGQLACSTSWTSGSVINIQKYDGSNWTTSVSTVIRASGTYRI
jgi:hypothetical protein